MTVFNQRQQEIAQRIDEGSELRHWKDWRWQLRNSVRTLEGAERILGVRFSADERKGFRQTTARFPMSVTPYYLSLINSEAYQTDPVFRQAFPSVDELRIERHDITDPLAEDLDSPVPGLTHRYPDRVLFHVSNLCSMYCRHCTRKRKVGDSDSIPERDQLLEGIEYIRATPQIRDVLLSGGDPLLLPDSRLDWLLGELRAIPHVEVIRLGTRIPVVLPYRITDALLDVLKRHHPLWINTHFNHPMEVTTSARQALAKLADAGIPLGNQSVLLAGVNDCPRIMRSLVHKLVMTRVRPYYIYQCDLAEGLGHFRTPVGKGIEIMESLIGHTSGFAVPTYVIDAPGGGGKIPIMPNYLLSWSTNKVVLRNYEGVITSYREPDSYDARFCDRDCDDCQLDLNLDDAPEDRAVGIEKLLADWDDTIALTPEDNDRTIRREDS
jgi:lysine 2,3-aminomutase